MMSFNRWPPPVIPTVEEELLYPATDEVKLAESARQFDKIVLLYNNLELLFADRADVIVAGCLFWYPVETRPEINQAPDVMVVIGRPKGSRYAYMQWNEENIAPQVVFDISTPNPRPAHLNQQFQFYDEYGVEEYYRYDVERDRWQGWLRDTNGALAPIPQMNGWHSPRLGIRFSVIDLELRLFHPSGASFQTFTTIQHRLKEVELRMAAALDRVDAAMERARAANEWAEAQAIRCAQAEIRAKIDAKARAEAERRVQELEAKLRAAGIH